jgi:hypothetical protein
MFSIIVESKTEFLFSALRLNFQKVFNMKDNLFVKKIGRIDRNRLGLFKQMFWDTKATRENPTEANNSRNDEVPDGKDDNTRQNFSKIPDLGYNIYKSSEFQLGQVSKLIYLSKYIDCNFVGILNPLGYPEIK